MGHGDEIVIADANFPALDAPQMAEVITDLMPLDAFF